MKYIICDDNIEFSDLLKRNIQALEPHSTCIVYNSLSALKFNLEDIAEDTDAVFLDIRLKDGNGIKAARDISRDFPHLKFVYVTGYGDEYSQAIFENPIDTAPVAYLVKPVQQKYLKNALSKLKEHRRHDERFLSVKCNRSMVLVPTEKIMYISSDKRRLTIHTADGETVFYGKISKITEFKRKKQENKKESCDGSLCLCASVTIAYTSSHLHACKCHVSVTLHDFAVWNWHVIIAKKKNKNFNSMT